MLKNLSAYFSIYPFKSNGAKLEVVMSTPLTGARAKIYRAGAGEKKGNNLIGCNLKASWLFVMGYL